MVGTYSDGYCNTRCISAGADAVLAGKPAYYDTDGYFTTVSDSPRVGTFQGERDANGYARVWINRMLPYRIKARLILFPTPGYKRQ